MCVRCPFRDGRWGRVELSRAIDLCDQALRMIEGACAVDGERGTQVLLALSEYKTMMTALGLSLGLSPTRAGRRALDTKSAFDLGG